MGSVINITKIITDVIDKYLAEIITDVIDKYLAEHPLSKTITKSINGLDKQFIVLDEKAIRQLVALPKA